MMSFFLFEVVENSFCKQVYGTMYNIPINGYHVCAGPIKEGESGTCVVSRQFYGNIYNLWITLRILLCNPI